MAYLFVVDTTQVDALARKYAGSERVIHDAMVEGMTRTGLALERAAKAAAPVKTGTLRRSITSTVSASARSYIARVGTNVPYAIYVEEGRGPIVAGPGKVLRFEIGGVVFFRKRVGPARAQPFMKNALIANQAAIVREFAEVVPAKIAKALAV